MTANRITSGAQSISVYRILRSTPISSGAENGDVQKKDTGSASTDSIKVDVSRVT
jgi:hypothetical protein